MKLQKTRPILLFITITAFILAILFPNRIWGEVQPITEVQEKLKGISDEEKEILEDLFALSQEIEEMDREGEKISQRINTLQVEIKDLEGRIEARQKDYHNQMEIMRQVLVSYQKNGPASYLETILTSENLSAFLRSINIIKDLTRNVGDLLDSIEEGKKQLSIEKENLAKSMASLKGQQEELQEALSKKLQYKEEQEAYLDSLEEERGHYQEQLENVQQLWTESKAFFADMAEEFRKLMEDGGLSVEALNLRFEFPSIKGTLYEKTINDMLKERPGLSEMQFYFYRNRVVLEVPEKQLVLEGTFSIEEKKAIKFEVDKGSFYQLPLEDGSIEELFRGGYWLIDFQELLGGSDLQFIKMMEGYLEFKMTASLW